MLLTIGNSLATISSIVLPTMHILSHSCLNLLLFFLFIYYDCLVTMNGHSSSLRGFMVEFRMSSNSTTFDGSLSHVGEFAIASGYADITKLQCGGVSVLCVLCVYCV